VCCAIGDRGNVAGKCRIGEQLSDQGTVWPCLDV